MLYRRLSNDSREQPDHHDNRGQCRGECHDLCHVELLENALDNPDVRPVNRPEQRQRQGVHLHEPGEEPAARAPVRR